MDSRAENLKFTAIFAGIVVVLAVFIWVVFAYGRVWPFNDHYHGPYVEVPKAFHRHPDAFQHAAYNMLTLAQTQPDAVHGYIDSKGGESSWALNSVDPTTGKQKVRRSGDERVRSFVDIPGVPGGQSVFVQWQHAHPGCVFFFYTANARQDWERIDQLRLPGQILVATSVVLAYHPTGGAPTRFIDGTATTYDQQLTYDKRKEKDPLWMGPEFHWHSKQINQNWTVYYR